uniref:Mediator complex subunit 15 n=1 Tax=Strongyloides venezuelensis TaxID=75913 RepID=A0A0K0F9U7_STRVS
MRIQSPQQYSFLSPQTSGVQNSLLNSTLSSSNNSTPTSSTTISTATSPGTPEAVRHHGGVSPVPFELVDKLLSLIKEKPSYDRDQRSKREVEHKIRRFNQVMKNKSRTIKNPILKKFLQKKKE